MDFWVSWILVFPSVSFLLEAGPCTTYRLLRVSLIACQTLKHLLEMLEIFRCTSKINNHGVKEKVISLHGPCFFSRMAVNQQAAHTALNFIYTSPVYSVLCCVVSVYSVRDGLLDFSVFTLKHSEPTAVVLLCKLQ